LKRFVTLFKGARQERSLSKQILESVADSKGFLRQSGQKQPVGCSGIGPWGRFLHQQFPSGLQAIEEEQFEQ
jgi:hypothetical protein